MGSYVLNFAVYTLAMTGLIFFALYVYKKVMSGALNPKSSKNLCIEEVLNINPRKSLMVVRVEDERFLIASDVDKTTLISKLKAGEDASYGSNEVIHPVKSRSGARKRKNVELQVIDNFQTISDSPDSESSSIKELAKKINRL